MTTRWVSTKVIQWGEEHGIEEIGITDEVGHGEVHIMFGRGDDAPSYELSIDKLKYLVLDLVRPVDE